MGLGIRGWRRVGLGVELGAFRDQGVEVVGLGVDLGAFRDQGVETGRFRG